MRLLLLLLCVSGALLATPARAQTVQLTGTWRLEAGRSDAPLLEGPRTQAPGAVVPPAEAASLTAQGEAAVRPTETLTIDQALGRVSLQRSTGVLRSPASLTVDGVVRATTSGGLPTTTRAWWAGAALLVETTQTVTLPEGRAVESRATETFTLAPDGTLAQRRSVVSDGLTRTWRFVYARMQ